MKRGLKFNPKDVVGVVIEDIRKGDSVKIGDEIVIANEDIVMPHKIALKDIHKGDNIYKYGEIMGYATQDIKKGDHVHVHNVDSEKLMK
jgi:altronate dehydratase